MDPALTSDGQLYGPIRFKQIAKERYYISKHSNTNYVDAGKLTPIEREYLLSFISEDLKKTQELWQATTKK